MNIGITTIRVPAVDLPEDLSVPLKAQGLLYLDYVAQYVFLRKFQEPIGMARLLPKEERKFDYCDSRTALGRSDSHHGRRRTDCVKES